MQKVTQGMLTEFIVNVADLKPSNIPDDNAMCYYSKIDGAYFTRKGMEKEGFKFLLQRGVTEQLQNADNEENHTVNIGFNPLEQKWYGWSHRAIFGFGVGSKVKKGNCGYVADNPAEMIDDYANFFSDISPECVTKHRSECMILPDESGIMINHKGVEIPTAKDFHELVESFSGEKTLPKELVLDGLEIKKCGKGEWVAKTIEDAKQMAKDFAEGVS